MENIILASTRAANAVSNVLTDLEGKLTGTAFRVPTSDVSVIDLTVELERSASYQEISEAIREASLNPGIGETLGYTTEKVVSTDFRGCSLSSIFDADAGFALDETFVKLIAWYDNEYGYTCNMLRLAQHIVGKSQHNFSMTN